MGRVPEVSDVHEPDQDTDNRDDLGEHVAKVVELTLEWCLFTNLGGDGLVNITNGCLLAGEHDDGECFAINYAGTLNSLSAKAK